MHAGETNAVQNFNENLASLGMLAVYGGLLFLYAPINAIVIGFDVFMTRALASFGIAYPLSELVDRFVNAQTPRFRALNIFPPCHGPCHG